ncbi:transposase-like protein [Bradyrhizobium sp. F1.13.4]
MSDEVRHIVCPHCTSTNRIPARRDARQAKCGHCRQHLFTGHPTPVSARSFATHIQRNDIPGCGRFLGGVVRTLQSDGAGF